MNHKKILKILAIILLIIVSINVVYHAIELEDFGEILWYCNISAFILCAGIFLKNSMLINTVLISGIVSQFSWILDFILTLIGEGSGRTEWIFEYGYFVLILSTLLHAFVIPLSFYGSIIYGYSTKSILPTIIFFGLMLFLTYFFTDISENRNCIFYPCDMSFSEYSDIMSVGIKNNYNTLLYTVSEILGWMLLTTTNSIVLYFIFKKLKTTEYQRAI